MTEHALKQIATFLKGWGGLLGGAVIVIAWTVLLYANFNHRIEAIESRTAAEAKQWEIIREHTTRITAVEVKTKPITQASWEKWGAVQKDVQDNAKNIDTLWKFHSRNWTDGIRED